MRKEGGGCYYPHWQQQPLYERKCNCRQALSLSQQLSAVLSHQLRLRKRFSLSLHSMSTTVHTWLIKAPGQQLKKMIMMINRANKMCVYYQVLTGSPVLSSTRRGGGGGWFLSLRTSIPPRLSSYQAVTCTVSTVVK